MSGGRTTWWGKDAAWYGRGRVIALGERFGADGILVLDWLCCEAQQQRDGGSVKADYRAVARGCFLEVDRARDIVAYAATLCALDDFQDGDPFTARISGWKADQEAIRAAARQAKARAGEETTPAPSHASSRSVTVSHAESYTRPDQTIDEQSSSSSGLLANLLADLIEQNGSRRPRIGKKWLDSERLLLTADGRPAEEAERVLRWCQQDDFWRGNVLSMPKFREKYDQLRLRMERPGVPGRENASSMLVAIRGGI